MKTYRFYTQATMKEYNCKNWWISSDVIKPMLISADSVKEALSAWREKVQDETTIQISDSALKRKNAMYRDRKDGTSYQCGYVITASDEYFRDDAKNRWTKQYIELWVEITEEVRIDFEAA